MTTVGVGMMVKNESAIITRALDSAWAIADYVLVVDTGSEDDTKAKVNKWLEDTVHNGRVIDEPWVDFGHNRSFVLAAMRDIADIDYCLMLDADEVIECDDPETVKASLSADAYDLPIHRGPLIYPLPRLTRNSKPFSYQVPEIGRAHV